MKKTAMTAAIISAALLCGCAEITDALSGLNSPQAPTAPAAAPAAGESAAQISAQAPAQAPAQDPAQDQQQAPASQAPEQAPPVQQAPPTPQPPAEEAVQEQAPAENVQQTYPDPSDLYSGIYYDADTGKGVMTITSAGGNLYTVNVSWTAGQSDTYTWDFSGEFDGRACLHYENSVKNFIEYQQDGTYTTLPVYSFGTGYIKMMSEDSLVWSDSTDGADSTFIKAQW